MSAIPRAVAIKLPPADGGVSAGEGAKRGAPIGTMAGTSLVMGEANDFGRFQRLS